MRNHTSKVMGRTGGPIRRMQGSKGRGSREYRFTSTLNKEQGNEKERFYAHRCVKFAGKVDVGFFLHHCLHLEKQTRGLFCEDRALGVKTLLMRLVKTISMTD